MTNKEFTEATDNFIYMIVNDSTFNERRQREQLNNITGLTGAKLDKLYKDIARTIFIGAIGEGTAFSYDQSIG